MIQIKTALRLGRYDREHLVNCINNVDNYIIDTCSLVDKFKKNYYKKYDIEVNKGLTGLTRLPLFRGVSVYDLQSLALTSISLRDLPFL